MMYPRGLQITDPADPAVVAHAVTVAVELGADLVKTNYVGSDAEMLRLTTASPVPVVVAGGKKFDSEEALMDFVDAAMRGGAAGVAMGRNVFLSPDPGALTRRLAERVHGGIAPRVPVEMATIR